MQLDPLHLQRLHLRRWNPQSAIKNKAAASDSRYL